MSRVRLVGCGLVLLAVVSCGPRTDPPSPATPTPAELTERERLVRQLVARGDRALSEDSKNRTAFNAYEFAVIYAPADAAIRAKRDGAPQPDAKGILPADVVERVKEIGDRCRPTSLARWEPKTGADAELTELRLLGSPELTGDLQVRAGHYREGLIEVNFVPRSSPFLDEKAPDLDLAFFLHKPMLDQAAVRSLLGTPDAEVKDQNRIAALTYGRFRIALDEKGISVAVYFLPFKR